MPAITHADRVIVVGMNGSGKSKFISWLVSEIRTQRVLLDFKDEWVLKVPGAVTVRTPKALEVALREGRSPFVRYVPSSANRDELERVFEVLWSARELGRPITLWTDEGYAVSSANWSPEKLRLWQTQGRRLGLGHIVATQRPRNIARELFTEAQVIVVFTPPLTRDDLRTVAAEMRLTADELEAHLLGLERYGYVLYDRRDPLALTVCDPLPPALLKQAERTATQVEKPALTGNAAPAKRAPGDGTETLGFAGTSPPSVPPG